MAVFNIISFATKQTPDYVGVVLNFIVGVICMSGIGMIYDEYKADMKLFNGVSIIQ